MVLLESGIAASSLSWAVVQPAIATFTRVCAYDRAGLAWSDVASCPGASSRSSTSSQRCSRVSRRRSDTFLSDIPLAVS